MIKVIVFDFDGTLVDSEKIKQDGFFQIFDDNKNHERIAQDVKNKNKELDRRSSIQLILESLKKNNFINYSDINTLTNEYVDKYSYLVNKKVIDSGLRPNTLRVLNYCHDKYILFLNSNTPQDSLNFIINSNGIGKFFKKIYGYFPNTKKENMQKIINEVKVDNNSDILLVGDGNSDFNIAKEFGLSFIGFKTDLNNWDDNNEFRVIDDLGELIGIV